MNKKICLKLLVISIVFIIASNLILRIGNMFSKSANDNNTTNTVTTVNRENITPAEGHVIIFNALGNTAGLLGKSLLMLFVGLTQLLFGLLIIVFQTLAWILQIGKEKKGKTIASMVLTYISIFILVLYCITWIVFHMLLRTNTVAVILIILMNVTVIYLFTKNVKLIKVS